MVHILNTNPVQVNLVAYATNVPGVRLLYKDTAPSPDLVEVVEYGQLFSSTRSIPEPAVLPAKDKIDPNQVSLLLSLLLPLAFFSSSPLFLFLFFSCSPLFLFSSFSLLSPLFSSLQPPPPPLNPPALGDGYQRDNRSGHGGVL